MSKTWASDFYRAVLNTPLQAQLGEFAAIISAWQNKLQHKDQKLWQKQLDRLPELTPSYVNLADTIEIGKADELSFAQQKSLTPILKNFMPWRKGPFSLFDIHIDTEWRSDWKWQRVLPQIDSLKNKRVLDVGCGSGYHLFRMHEAGAEQVIGLDPTTLFFYQFHVFKRYLSSVNIHYLPIGIEEMPKTEAFDTVFSMGVLYHRLDPLAFLKQLKQQLTKGGQLVLETLVIEGNENTVLLPSERYAQMRNVYFLPSSLAMISWLKKVGFNNIKLVDENVTTIEEQRSTEWMTNHSLIDFLDPNDSKLTIEGYPAPRRATFIAYK